MRRKTRQQRLRSKQLWTKQKLYQVAREDTSTTDLAKPEANSGERARRRLKPRKFTHTSLPPTPQTSYSPTKAPSTLTLLNSTSIAPTQSLNIGSNSQTKLGILNQLLPPLKQTLNYLPEPPLLVYSQSKFILDTVESCHWIKLMLRWLVPCPNLPLILLVHGTHLSTS
jgi:hypothetical protein